MKRIPGLGVVTALMACAGMAVGQSLQGGPGAAATRSMTAGRGGGDLTTVVVPGMALPTNISERGYPRILAENRVVFQVTAPRAGQVQINLGKNYDMTKNEAGVWTVTTDPQVPGFHYYSLVIDGVSVSDPASQAFYGTGRWSSAIDIPEAGADFYAVKDVPHGNIRATRYFSKLTNSWRPCNIYTPPGYDKETDKKYPVLYIQHGGGEDETGWAVQGKTDVILDNLIAAGKAKAMLVVMPNGNVPNTGGAGAGGRGGGGGGGYSAAGMAGYGNELLNNIIPFVEGNYRVAAGAENRALSGLSMGGGQAFYTGLGNKEKFGAIGVFSTGLFGGIANPAGGGAGGGFDGEAQVPGLYSNAKAFNEALKVFYISVGEQDPRFEPTKAAVAAMKEKGLKVEFASFPGSHEWQVWRKSLNDFAQRIFK